MVGNSAISFEPGSYWKSCWSKNVLLKLKQNNKHLLIYIFRKQKQISKYLKIFFFVYDNESLFTRIANKSIETSNSSIVLNSIYTRSLIECNEACEDNKICHYVQFSDSTCSLYKKIANLFLKSESGNKQRGPFWYCNSSSMFIRICIINVKEKIGRL